MKSTFFKFKSGQSQYLFCPNNQFVSYSNEQLSELIDNDENNSLTIDPYYRRKLEYFKRNNLFQQLQNNNLLEKRITKEDVLQNLKNTSNIIFEVTENCNLSCTYCIYGDLYNFGQTINSKVKIDIDSSKKLLSFFDKLWNSNDSFAPESFRKISFYGGEPLLNIAFIKEIVSYCKTLKSKNFIFTMTTNAVLIDKHIDFLVENNFQILVSLDGNAFHNRYRKLKNNIPSFDLVFKNLKFLYNNFPDFFRKNIEINSVLTKENDLADINNFLQIEFKKESSISPLTNIKVQDQVLFKKLYKKMDSDKIYSSQKMETEDAYIGDILTSRFISNITGSSEVNYSDFFSDRNTKKSLPTGTCSPFYDKIMVKANGKIMLCEQTSLEFTFGESTTSGIKIDTDKVVKIYNTLYDKITKLHCKKCAKVNECTVCVMNAVFLQKDNFNCPDFVSIPMYGKEIGKQVHIFHSFPMLYKKKLEFFTEQSKNKF